MTDETRKVIQPRIQTPLQAERGSSTSTCGLPDDLLTEQVRRLGVFAGAGIGLWAAGVVMDLIAGLTMLAPHPTWKAQLIETLGILNSTLLLLYVRYSRHTPQTKTDVGLVALVLNALLIAMFNSWVMPPSMMQYLSWNTIVILVFAMTAPSTPRKMFVASIVAASMDPLGFWLAHLRGEAVPSILNTFVLFMPNYSCAVVAMLSSQALHRLGRQIRTAREMGSYQLVELLGRGGMGEVWRAQHRLLVRSAAIKLVRPEMLGGGTGPEAMLVRRRFEREVQATASLSSAHTINVFDFGITGDGMFYYVMELLLGRDLETLVREFGPIPAERAIYLLRQICHSLAEAHAGGLIHRDIKPANIYVCRMGLEYDFVKVLDFGLVKYRDRDAAQTLLTADHMTTGTPAYMAPEIILGEAEVDRRADVYAIGCVAYFMLTGQLVFEADTPMKMLVQHVQGQPVPPSRRTELPIPPELDEIVLACLEKDPDKRPQDAQVLFELACQCNDCAQWSSDAARSWWEQHLPELTGPLRLVEPASDLPDRALAIN